MKSLILKMNFHANFFHLFQKSARQQAEKRFKSVLEKGGVSEEEISRIISLSEN